MPGIRLSMPVIPSGFFTASAASVGLDESQAQSVAAGNATPETADLARLLMTTAAQRLARTFPLGRC